MFKLKISIVGFFFFNLLNSQINYDNTTKSIYNQYSNWDTFFSYNYISDIKSDGRKIYFVSNSTFFIYDILNYQIEKIDTLNGLSGDEISSFFVSNENNLVFIGYNNGLIQILDIGANSIINIFDIVNKPSISPNNKLINNFTEFNDQLFISTGYGVSVFDINNFEFADTYYIRSDAELLNVSDISIIGDYIYTSVNNIGIFKSNVNLNLINDESWIQIYSGDVNSILTINQNIYFNDNTNIYKIEGDQILNIQTINSEILSMNKSEDKIIITTRDKCVLYNENFSDIISTFNSNDYTSNFNIAHLENNDLFIGTEESGVLKIENLNYQNYLFFLPPGPEENNIFSVEASGNNFWTVFGDYTEYFNPYPLKFTGISKYDLNTNQWLSISTDSIPEMAVNLNNISINPFNQNNIFISSFHGGLLELMNENIINFYDSNNSDLESVDNGDPNYISIRISDLEFDDNGNLWLLNSRIDSPLKLYEINNNNWSNFNFNQIIDDGFQDELGFNDIEIDSYGNKWIAGLRSGLIGFNENSGNPKIRKINSIEGSNLPSSYVKSIAVDRNNHLWIGTIKGLRVLYNTSNFFDAPTVTLQKIIILEDDIPRELLEQQYITDIEVDGANNKWVGTIGSGVFYFSSNGQQTIYHFTKNNSPLPSNNINDISIDLLNGKVYFGTDKGLVSFSSGSSSTNQSLSEAYIYPNPVRPNYDIKQRKIKITGLSENVNIKIVDIAGNLVAEAQSRVNNRYNGFNLEIDGGTAFWNGKNLRDIDVSTGVYVVMLSDLDTYETKTLKVMIIK